MTLLQTVYESLGLQPTGLSFLFVVLPVFLAAFYLAPVRARPPVLLGLCLLYYALAEPVYLPLMLASMLLNYALLRLLLHFDGNEAARRACALFCVLLNIALLLGSAVVARPQALGVQIYTLSALDAVLSAYRRQAAGACGIVRFGLHCCFFPKLYAGPLAPFDEQAGQLNRAALDVTSVLAGLGQYVEGACKASVIGGNLFALYRSLRGLAPGEATALSSWCVVFCAAFSLYFLLSGFSDMAQGIGRAFGLSLPKNFYYPYQSRTVEDFLNRFNITVYRFLHKLVYTGIAGGRSGLLTDALGILAVGTLMGLWFGLRLNHMLWGAYLAVFVILERYVYPKALRSIPTLFSRLGTLCVVLAGFPIFIGESLAESASLVRSMLGFDNLFNDQVLYLLSSNWLLVLLSCFFATNAASLAVTALRRGAPRFASWVMGGVDLAILVVYVSLSL